MTVALAWICPEALTAVRVYVVVCAGLTAAQSFAFKLVPTPGVIEIEVALMTFQQSCVVCPAVMALGVATKVATCGSAPAATVTVTGAVTVCPFVPVTLRV